MLFSYRCLRALTRSVIFIGIGLAVGCASLPDPDDYAMPESHVMENTSDTRLARGVQAAFGSELEQAAFLPLGDGMKAFVARMALIAAAERTLDVQYYIWHPDTSGSLLVGELLKAADRGVRVRLLLDDLDTQGKDTFLGQLDVHPNIEVRLYNAFGYRGSRGIGFASDLKRLNHRMHNKSLTADNQATIVGGRNIGNEYFNAVAHTGFADLDVLAVGPVVADVSNMFDLYWNSDMVVPMSAFADKDTLNEESLKDTRDRFAARVDEEAASDYVQAIRDSRMLESLAFSEMPMIRGDATLIYDDPRKLHNAKITRETHLAPNLAPIFDQATRQVVVVSPYFVPGDKMVDFFVSLVERGIQVRILTNSLAANDVGMVHAGYMRYRKDLLRGGVQMYEFKAERSELTRNKKWTGSSSASLHAKTLGADSERLFVGSFNLDPRSVALNTEMGVIIENKELAQQLTDAFNTAVAEQAYEVRLVDGNLQWTEPSASGPTKTYDKEPQTTWWQRFVAGTLSYIVPESML